MNSSYAWIFRENLASTENLHEILESDLWERREMEKNRDGIKDIYLVEINMHDNQDRNFSSHFNWE